MLEGNNILLSKRLVTTEYNQAMQIPGLYSVFSHGMAIALRILSVVVGVISVICSIINLYLLSCLHKNFVVFRHDFLRWLFWFDLSKDFILTVFPLLTLITEYTYNWSPFYNIVGFITNLTMVGADFMVFFLSLHFVLLIFKPSLNKVDHRRNKVEGGLFRYKIYVFAFSVAFSTLCSALVFINFNKNNNYLPNESEITEVKNNDGSFVVDHTSKMGGYKPFATIVGLPVYPIFYSLFLNWLWRYCIMICIIVFYAMIYVKYTRESKINQKKIKNLQQNCSDNAGRMSFNRQQIEDITKDFNVLLYDEFSKRNQAFKKQLYQLFLYPICYFVLWIAPFIESIEQPIYEVNHGPLVPISIISTFCHPANGIFDFIIFMTREKPFHHYWTKVEKEVLISEYLENKNRINMDIKDKWELCNNTLLGRKGYYYSGNAVRNIIEDDRFIIDNHLTIRWYWRFYHRLPLKGGIDLDLLELSKERSQENINDKRNDFLSNNNASAAEISNVSQSEMFALVSKYKSNPQTILVNEKNQNNTNWINEILLPNVSLDNSVKPNAECHDIELQMNDSFSLRSGAATATSNTENEILDIQDIL